MRTRLGKVMQDDTTAEMLFDVAALIAYVSSIAELRPGDFVLSTNHVIDVDGDTATASHYVIGVHVLDAGAPARHAAVGGRYQCECVRTADGWRLSHVRIEVLWSGGEDFRLEPAAGEG